MGMEETQVRNNRVFEILSTKDRNISEKMSQAQWYQQRTNHNQQKDLVTKDDENTHVTFHEDSKMEEENGVGIETTPQPLRGST